MYIYIYRERETYTYVYIIIYNYVCMCIYIYIYIHTCIHICYEAEVDQLHLDAHYYYCYHHYYYCLFFIRPRLAYNLLGKGSLFAVGQYIITVMFIMMYCLYIVICAEAEVDRLHLDYYY